MLAASHTHTTVQCNGAQPHCQVCLSKGTKCVYIADDNTSNVKTKNVRLKKDLSSMLELFWDLQTKSAPEAKQLLDRIRAGDDISSLLRDGHLGKLAASEQGNAGPSPPSSMEDFTASFMDQPSFLSPCDPLGNMTPPTDISEGVGDPVQYVRPTKTVNLKAVLEIPLPDFDTFKDAINYFYECTGSLFHSFTLEEGQELLERLSKHQAGDIPKALLCEISSMAAVSSLYSRGKIAPELTDSFYTMAKQYLDDSIEANPFRATKVCVLLAMFNIVNKGTVALAYAELGLRLAHRLGLYKKKRPVQMSKATWVDAKQVWRTLMFSRGWLSATLGYITDDAYPLDVLDGHELDNEEEELSVDDMCQTEIAKISTLKAQLLRILFTSHTLSVGSLRTVKEGLGNWYANLPHEIGLGNMDMGIDSVAKASVFFIHLQHLGALMLVHRRIMLYFTNTDPGEWISSHLLSEAAQSAEEGLIAAKQSARILDLLVQEESLFRKCWLGM